MDHHTVCSLEKKRDTIAATFLCVLVGVIAVVINPLREFPLNDDWTHALTIRAFAENGNIFYPAWLSAFSYLNILYGSIIVSLFGFSFSVLRLTNIFFALCTILLLYRFLRIMGTSSLKSALGAALLFVNPLFLYLAFSFMGDIPSLFFFLASLYFFWNGMRLSSYRAYGLGVACALLAFSIRQIMLIPFLVAAVLFFSSPRFQRKRILLFSLGGVCGITLIVLIAATLHATPTIPIRLFFSEDTPQIHALLSMRMFMVFIISGGIAILPALLSRAFYDRSLVTAVTRHPLSIALSILFGASILGIAYSTFLTSENIVTHLGIGLNINAPILGGRAYPWGAHEIYLGVIGMSLLGMLYFLILAWRHRKGTLVCSPAMLLFYSGGAYLLCIVIILPFFDRYYVPLIPLLIIGITCILEKYRTAVLVYAFAVVLLGVYSTVGMVNYFAWNDARWSLAERLVTRGIPAEYINGGYEWNGWHLYTDAIDPLIRSYPSGKNFLPEVNAVLHGDKGKRYRISFSQIDGYTVVDREPIKGVFFQYPVLYALKKTMP